jgi:serine/threonine protein kinase
MAQDDVPTAAGSLRTPPASTAAKRTGHETDLPVSSTLTELPPQDVGTIVRMVALASESRHEPQGFLAAGGMGTIDVVLDRTLNRRSVMKRIHTHLADDARSVRMFVREAQVTGQLEHPNIVPVHELGVEGERSLYFTMKLVEGRTLLELIKALPPGPREHTTLLEMLDVIVKVCDALAFAHSNAIVHCDIKPANVMVGDFGQVYLMDWGVARVRKRGEPFSAPAATQSTALGPTSPGTVISRETPGAIPPSEHLPSDASGVVPGVQSEFARTEHGFLVGTPTHMSPEQALAQNEKLDERSDVFAVGALVYHFLTGRAPYEAETFWAAVALAQRGEFPSIESICGEGRVPRALLRIVERAMAVDPAQRYQSIVELSGELLRFVRGGDSFPALSFGAGEYIIREGEPGDAAYIIKSGQCEALKGEGDDRRVLRRMGPGEVFGEMAILSPGPRTASVVTTQPTTVHVVNAEVFDRELEALKPWFGSFVRTLAERFRDREKSSR